MFLLTRTTSRRTIAVGLLAALIAASTSFGQDSQPAKVADDPREAGRTRDHFKLVEDGIPFVFFLDNPKKKKLSKKGTELVAKWSIVDLDARRTAWNEYFEKRQEAVKNDTEKSDEQKEAEIEQLEVQKIQQQNNMENIKLRVESRQNPRKKAFSVIVERTTVDKKLRDRIEGLKNGVKRDWKNLDWIDEGTDRTSGGDKRKNRTRMSIEFKGTDQNGESRWLRIDVVRAFGGDRSAQVPYFVTIQGDSPSSEFGRENKAAMDALFDRHFQIP